MNKGKDLIPTNQLEVFCILDEPDNTKSRKPVNLLEITLHNFDGKTIHSRMNVPCAMQLAQEIIKVAQEIVSKYPISESRKVKHTSKWKMEHILAQRGINAFSTNQGNGVHDV